jgi:hypothetical protein
MYRETTDPRTGVVKDEAYGPRHGPLHGLPISTPYMTKDYRQLNDSRPNPTAQLTYDGMRVCSDRLANVCGMSTSLAIRKRTSSCCFSFCFSDTKPKNNLALCPIRLDPKEFIVGLAALNLVILKSH